MDNITLQKINDGDSGSVAANKIYNNDEKILGLVRVVQEYLESCEEAIDIILSISIVSTSGTSETSIMTQKATTDLVIDNSKDDCIIGETITPGIDIPSEYEEYPYLWAGRASQNAEGHSLTTMYNDIEDLNDTVGQIEQGISTLNDDVSDLGNRVTSINNNVIKLSSSANTLSADVSQLESDVTTLNNNVNQLTIRVSGHENDITVLENSVTTINGNVTQIENTIDEQGDDITRLGNRIDTQDIEISRRLNEQQEKIDTLEGNDVLVCESTSALPTPGDLGTIYRVCNDPDSSHYSDYMWDANASTPSYKKLATYEYPGIDDKPTKNSARFVKSGGVFDAINNGGVFDLTLYNSGLTYTSLSSALSSVPSNYRRGGMTLKYVQEQESGNKYVQYFNTYSAFTQTISRWQGLDDKPTAGSNNLITSGGVYSFKKTTNYAFILDRIPVLNVTNSSFTIPSGTSIYGNGRSTRLNADVTYTRTSGSFGSHYLLYDWSDDIINHTRMVDGNKDVVLGDTEYLIALVRWIDGYVYQGNFPKYTRTTSDGDENVDLIPKALHTTDTVSNNNTNLITSGGVYAYRRLNNFAYITNGTPKADTVNGTFTLSSGTTIYGRNRGLTLESDILFERPSFGTCYLFYDWNSKTVRYLEAYNEPVIGSTEFMIALYRFTDGAVIQGNFSKYLLDGVEASFISEYKGTDVAASDYALVYNGTPVLDSQSTPITFTLPAGTKIAQKDRVVTLPEDLVFTRPSEPVWGTHYLICVRTVSNQNVVTYSTRIERNYVKELILGQNEFLIALVRWQVGVLRANFNTYIKNGGTIDLIPTQPISTAQTLVLPKMFNPPINLLKPGLKVLDIGNSYTVDSQHYVGDILSKVGYTTGFSLYSATLSWSSFKDWYDVYNDNYTRETAGGEVYKYSIYKKAGDLLNTVNTGDFDGDNGAGFRDLLTSTKWDLILIHQRSNYANDYSNWEGHGEEGYLKEYIRTIRKNQPQATIGFLLVHSYYSNYGSNTEHSSLLRWQHIVNATQQLKANYGIDFIIPYGTAVQNMRTLSPNPPTQESDEYMSDGAHLNDFGDYIASCCYYQTLFAPITGICVEGTEAPDGTNFGPTNVANAQSAAVSGTYNMWEITPID